LRIKDQVLDFIEVFPLLPSLPFIKEEFYRRAQRKRRGEGWELEIGGDGNISSWRAGGRAALPQFGGVELPFHPDFGLWTLHKTSVKIIAWIAQK
jgi:hypothetical protein